LISINHVDIFAVVAQDESDFITGRTFLKEEGHECDRVKGGGVYGRMTFTVNTVGWWGSGGSFKSSTKLIQEVKNENL
jgi:hypothetical protein